MESKDPIVNFVILVVYLVMMSSTLSILLIGMMTALRSVM